MTEKKREYIMSQANGRRQVAVLEPAQFELISGAESIAEFTRKSIERHRYKPEGDGEAQRINRLCWTYRS